MGELRQRKRVISKRIGQRCDGKNIEWTWIRKKGGGAMYGGILRRKEEKVGKGEERRIPFQTFQSSHKAEHREIFVGIHFRPKPNNPWP